MNLLFSVFLATATAQEDPPANPENDGPTETEQPKSDENSGESAEPKSEESSESPVEPADETESKPDTETTPPQIEAAKPPEPKPPEPNPNDPIMGVELKLTSGVPLRGFSPILSVIDWKKGQSMYIRINDSWMFIESEKIESIRPLDEAEQEAITQAPRPSSQTTTSRPIRSNPDRSQTDYENYTSSRYIYSPSAIPMKAGEGYVSEKLFLFTSAAYAINDNWTILGGTITWFPPALFILGTKVSFPLQNNVHISIGGESFMSGISGFESLANIGFTGVTFGDKESNVTINAGIGDINGSIGYPVSVSAMKRINTRVVVMTENWFISSPDNDLGEGVAIASLALRFIPPPKRNTIGKNVWVTDVGLFGIIPMDSNDIEIIFPLPLLEFSYFF